MASAGGARAPVVCAGIVVADVFVPPLPRLPEPGELVVTDDFVVETGGCAANAAMALARLGVRPAVVAKVGDDVFGEFVAHELGAAGIDVSGIGRSVVLGTSKTVIVPVEGGTGVTSTPSVRTPSSALPTSHPRSPLRPT